MMQRPVLSAGRVCFLFALLSAGLFAWLVPLPAAGAEELSPESCKTCHNRGQVQAPLFLKSAHGGFDCTECHKGITRRHSQEKGKHPAISCTTCHEDIPGTGPKDVHLEWKEDGTPLAASCVGCHSEFHSKPRVVRCESCHSDVAESLQGSEHWKAGPAGKPHRVYCTDCHRDKHHIQPAEERDSPLNKTRVHEICANCHNDKNKPAHNPITGDTFVPVESYLKSIHGEKLGQVPGVASCTDCHGHHRFRTISDPASTLSRDHIIETCGKCHQGKLDQYLKGKHGAKLKEQQQKLAVMTPEEHAAYIQKTPLSERPPVCTSCHTSHSIRPAAHLGEFNEVQKLCSTCHQKEVTELGASIHRMVKDPDTGQQRSIRCQDCHVDYHDNKDIRAQDSVMNKRNLADTCARCHKEKVKVPETGDTFYPVDSYKQSIHGRGVYLSGLYFSAGCVDCHGSHSIFPLNDTRSTLHHLRLTETCGNMNCHVGIHDKFLEGTHGNVYVQEKGEFEKLPPERQAHFAFHGPVCTSCHVSHAIRRTDEREFFSETIRQCGKCHPLAMATYKHSYHGKAALLGSPEVAKCYDCHGSHVNPRVKEAGFTSEQILGICKKCHANATMQMVSYINHLELKKELKPGELAGLDQVGREKLRGLKVLRAVRFLMEILLVSVFIFFGIHTLLWFIRGMVDRFLHRHEVPLEKKTQYFLRIDRYNRIIHLFVVVSFMGLALTGLPIKYPDQPRSQAIFHALDLVFQGQGGQVARILHRGFAIITFGYLFFHLVYLFWKFLLLRHDETMKRFRPCPVDRALPPEGRGFAWYLRWVIWLIPVCLLYVPRNLALHWRKFWGLKNRGRHLAQTMFGPDSFLPRLKDLKDLWAHFKWFFWLSPKPKWDKYTYYEKFDYWAVFWGVAIIGTTGLCMWFKEFFTSTIGLPGWIINVAMEIHSHEALLAAGFIFSIHFFNGHLRPGRFPMDRVIFLGTINRHELEEERPELYKRLVESGELETIRRDRPPLWLRVLGTLFGTAALILGIILVVWIFKLELGSLFI